MGRDSQQRRASSELSPAKQKLLQARLAKAQSSSAEVFRIPARPPASRFPATSPQRRFWFIDELNPGNPAYNMHIAIELEGELDVGRLQAALDAVIDRHEVLRSRFTFENGELYQEISEDRVANLRRHARSSFSEPESLLIRLAREPFSLSHHPLFRADLVEIAVNKHVLLLVLHHIICDEPSIAILVREIAEHYTDPAAKRDDTVSTRTRFADYAQWQSERLPDVLRDQLPYWTEALAGLDERTSVPVDNRNPGSRKATGKIVRGELDAGIAAGVRSIAAEEKTTLLPVMLATWSALLSRYTGHRDVAVGTPVSLRAVGELDNTVGLFLNTLVLRTAVDPAESFRELLRRVRETVLNSFSHQEVPLESIVEAVNPVRGHGENPFFDTMVVQQDSDDSIVQFGDLIARHRWVDAGVCKFDLTMFFRESADGISLSLEYDTSLYEQRRMEVVLDHYTTLLQSLLDDPSRPVGKADYLQADEIEWLERCSVGRWQDVGDTPTVARQVEANLARLDQKVAVVDGKGSVSYHELNRLVAGMTDALLASNQSPRCVVILLERSRWAIAAMLGAWRIGACYVPLDPDYPAARVADTLEALAASDLDDFVIVTTAQHRSSLPAGMPCVLIDRPRPAGTSGRWPPPEAASKDSPAYIVFTSGSSGRPKGVVVTHENLRISNGARALVYGQYPENYLLLSPLAFDSSVAGIYWTLVGGGTLVIADHEQARDCHQIARLVEQHSISHTLMLPSLYELVLAAAEGSGLSSLDSVIVAGEACPESLYDAHAASVPQATLYNEYGPSEATVWATVQEVTGSDSPVPIGSSIPSVRAYVLDPQGELQAPGMPGELCLEGPSVSPGYLDRDNRRSFIHASLFGEERRLYRTGDAAKLDPQGRIQFIGRIDNQVKVRGHRVELDEVSAAVRRQFDVRDVATIFDPANQQLRTFVVTDARTVTPDTLLAKLRTTLPAYMVPQQMLVLDELPRLPNGKIDAARLPGKPSRMSDAEPDDPTYRAVKAAWCEVLGIEDAPPDAGFFELGGHSLLAARMIVKLQDVVGSQCPLSAIYENQTLREFHDYLSRAHTADEQDILYPARPAGSETPLFAIKTYLNYLLDLIDPDIPVFGLTHGRKAPGANVASVEELAARYLDAARRQQPRGPYRLLGYSFGALLAIEIAHQVVAAGDEVELLVLIDPPPPTPEGDTRFLATRALNRVRAAGSTAGQFRTALAEMRRIIRRRGINLRFRVARLAQRLLRRRTTSKASRWAGHDWESRARRAYKHKAYEGAALLLLMGREDLETDDRQLARWNGILQGETSVEVIHGPSDHVGLMEPPWIEQVGVAIKAALNASRRDETSAR